MAAVSPRRLGDLVEDITVGWVGPMADKYVPAGVPFLRTLNVKPYVISTADLMFISAEFHEKLRKSRLLPGDVVVARTGRPGTAAVMPEWMGEANCSDLVVIRPGEEVDPRFLAYYLNSSTGKHLIHARNVGSVQSHFNIKSARGLPFPETEIDEQRRIAAVLGALDDKIDLNRRMNRTLEAMAQAIFKSWFIDFDGVPDSELVDSELGPIPKGWEVKPIDAIMEVISGGTPKKSEATYWGGDVPWFSVKDAPQPYDVFVLRTEQKITEKGLEGSSARLVLPWTTIVSARGTVGKTAVAAQPMAFNQSCYGVRSSAGHGDIFVHYALKSVIDHFQRSAHGSVFDTITRRTFKMVTLATPSVEKAAGFEAAVRPLLLRILRNCRESSTLADLRDALLPKLISGEIRVPEAEEAVEAAA